MGCEAINNYLAYESSRLGPWFYQKKMFAQSPLASLVKKAEYPREMGYDFRQITYERAAPTSILSWTAVTKADAEYGFSEDGESTNCGACANSFNAIDSGYSTRTCIMSKYELKSRMFCVEDFRAAWEVRQQLDALRNQLGSYVRHVWDQKYREDIFGATKYKVVADGSIDGNYSSSTATAYPSACATDILQDALLEYWYFRLIRDGAGDGQLIPGSEPILTLVCSPELSRSLVVQDSNVREDIRYAQPGTLMNRLGAKIMKGFAHVIDPFPRRFTCSGGTYTQVAPFASDNKTILTGAELNSSYLNAPYEEATIYHPDLYTCLVPRPITNPGGGTSFDPVSYTGEWRWANLADVDGTNVFNSMGRWYGRLWSAPLKVRPELGVSFIYRRCQTEMSAIPTTCVYS